MIYNLWWGAYLDTKGKLHYPFDMQLLLENADEEDVRIHFHPIACDFVDDQVVFPQFVGEKTFIPNKLIDWALLNDRELSINILERIG